MYLNLIQVADSFGVSEKIVEGWIRDEGMPYTTDRGRILFDRAQVVEWAADRGLGARAGFLVAQKSTLTPQLRLGPLLRAGGIWRDVPPADLLDRFEQIITSLPGATPSVKQLLRQRIRRQDGVTMAPIGRGFALPHPSTRIALGRESGTVALLLLHEPFPSPEPPVDGIPITRLFFFVAPSPRAHLDLLARLTRHVVLGTLPELIDKNAKNEQLLQALEAMDTAPSGGAP